MRFVVTVFSKPIFHMRVNCFFETSLKVTSFNLMTIRNTKLMLHSVFVVTDSLFGCCSPVFQEFLEQHTNMDVCIYFGVAGLQLNGHRFEYCSLHAM